MRVVEFLSDVPKSFTNINCPYCCHDGVFQAIGYDIGINMNMAVGHRKCPNPRCRGHVFIVTNKDEILEMYPPSRIKFNKEQVPQSVVDVFLEAIECHAIGCFTAAAIMVRRTLEEICHDRQATGSNLQNRIKALQSKVVLPQELFDGLDLIRLLGNDAAHVESKEFSEISVAQLDVAIEFTKEIIKSIYQYESLLNKFKSLKTPPS